MACRVVRLEDPSDEERRRLEDEHRQRVEDMEAFDGLPRALREELRKCFVGIKAVKVAAHYQRYGLADALAIVRLSNREISRSYLKTKYPPTHPGLLDGQQNSEG